MRKANSRRPEPVHGPTGPTLGYTIDLSGASVAEENIFYNYDDSEPASVTFNLSNGHSLNLYFSMGGGCVLLANAQGNIPRTTPQFRSAFNCPIGFVPILGPVEHDEPLYEKEAARLALFNYRAARNFRNIWYHYGEQFDEFRSILKETWPGMDIEPPKIDYSGQRAHLYMFCPEDRIPREIFWAGFGFQVWCQMLTHLVQSRDKSIFLIDEPDIYLHADLQRQLLSLLRNLGPDILLATHSTEIITEAEPDDIVLVNKKNRNARRIKSPSQLIEVFTLLGSNLNPILTQLAKTKRVVFVEGKDFQIIGRFARKLGRNKVANRSDFAVVPVDGFNPERVRSLKAGMETTLGSPVSAAVVFDKDYRSDAETKKVSKAAGAFCLLAEVHGRKELENFLLVPSAINRAAMRRIADHAKRTGKEVKFEDDATSILEEFAETKKSYITSQYIENRRRYEKLSNPKEDATSATQQAIEEVTTSWGSLSSRLKIIPGKEAISFINQFLQEKYGITVTPTSIIDSMLPEDVPEEMSALIEKISKFAESRP